jgi:hypothetical protein
MRVVDVLLAQADGCEVAVLRRSDMTEPEASHAVDSLYLLLVMRSCDAPSVPPHVAWGIGPDALVSCLRPEDTRVADHFPLSLGKRQAVRALVNVATGAGAVCRAPEEVDGVFSDSWLDVERFDALAMPPRCNSCFKAGCVLGTYGECRRCSSRDDPSAREWVR